MTQLFDERRNVISNSNRSRSRGCKKKTTARRATTLCAQFLDAKEKQLNRPKQAISRRRASGSKAPNILLTMSGYNVMT